MYPLDNKSVKKLLSNVFWIGGGSGSGKSTVAKMIAAESNLHLYETDAVMKEHARRSNEKDCPLLHAFMGMSMDERWVTRTPQEMLETFHWFNGEGFKYIIDDLLAFPAEQKTIVEGFRLLPKYVVPYLAKPSQAIWLIPTPKFRESAFKNRGSLWDIANKTSNPRKALSNYLERDRLFTERIRRETLEEGLHTLDLDETVTEADLFQKVKAMYAL
ncbi:hypothetical protein JD969_13500 [Planctomycetota bacterium]|nr:hypothetical protein JD969_13500 [Planctomycetota bacterium]